VKIRDLFVHGVQRLKEAAIPAPELEVALLLTQICNMTRTDLLLAGERILTDDQYREFEKNISRRLQREPLAYILEEKEFWSLPFTVTQDVLIPRPETEQLIELTLTTLRTIYQDSADQPLRILDLGTGSGIIAVVLAVELPAARITAVDLSFKALKVAAYNAEKHNVAQRIDFVNSDWLTGLALKKNFDVVLANPPYIASHILEKSLAENTGGLQPEVVSFEPRLALDGGENGVGPSGIISKSLDRILKSGGWFFMEIGAEQAEDVSAIFRETASYDAIAVHNDYAGLPRMFQARKM
jgi:release factor glutamine methyltransferase